MGFQGQFGAYTDTETGLVLMGHRYYDAGTGRFLTRDPLGYNGGINLYGFTGNNPVNEMDPEGTDPPSNLDEWYSAWDNTSLSDAWDAVKRSVTENGNLQLARHALSEAGGIAATYNPFGGGEEVLGGRILEAVAPSVLRGVEAARLARNARLAKQLLKGEDVEVKSIRDADQVLKAALPNAKKYKGMGPGSDPAGESLYTGKNSNGMYRKDYLVDPETGRLYGHDRNNWHGDFKHINVRLPSGKNVVIKITR